MKKILVNAFFISFFLMFIKTTSSEQSEQIQPILENKKNLVRIFGCHGIYTDHREEERKHNYEKRKKVAAVYIANLENKIKEILQDNANNIDKDIAKIIINYLAYDYLHFNNEKLLLTGGTSEIDSNTFVSSLSNLDLSKDMIGAVKSIINSNDSKGIIPEVESIYQWSLNQNHNFDIFFRIAKNNWGYWYVSHLGESQFMHCFTEDELEETFRKKFDNVDKNSEKRILLTKTSDSPNFAEEIKFTPNKQDSLIKFLTISSAISRKP